MAPASAALVAGLQAGLLVAGTATPVLTLRDPRIVESSGLARSVRHPRLLWTHNDGGSTADLFGVDPRGRTVARLRLGGIDPYDPEALAPGRDDRGRPALFLADIGDNQAAREDVSVFRVPEPATLGRHRVDPTWYRFSYEDGPHDAEALLVDPRDGRLWVATKSFGVGGLYRAPRRPVERSRGTNTLRRVADVPPLVTDGAFLPGGRFVLRTYTAAYVYDGPGRLRQEIALPPEPQGESVALDGDRLLVGSEGRHSKVLAVALPEDVRSRGVGRAEGGRRTPGAVAGHVGRGWAVAAAVTAGGLVLLGVAAGARRRRQQ